MFNNVQNVPSLKIEKTKLNWEIIHLIKFY